MRLTHWIGLSSNCYMLQTFLQTGLAHYKQAETQVFEHLKGGLPARRPVSEAPPAFRMLNLKWLSARLKGSCTCPSCASHMQLLSCCRLGCCRGC